MNYGALYLSEIVCYGGYCLGGYKEKLEYSSLQELPIKKKLRPSGRKQVKPSAVGLLVIFFQLLRIT